MQRIPWAIVVIVASFSSAADSGGSESMRSYTRARVVLDAGVTAIGGVQALTSLNRVAREFENQRTNPGQGPRLFGGASTIDKFPIFSRTPSIGVLDYAGERFWLSQRLLSESAQDWIATIDVAIPRGGFSTVAYREEVPVYTAGPTAAQDTMTREMRTYPEAMLRAALRRPATLQWLGDALIGGRRTHVISFVDADATRISLFFDEQHHLLVRSEVLSEHPYLGQATAASVYLDYRKTGRLMLPYRVEAWRNDEPLRILLHSRIEVDGPADDTIFAPPQRRIEAPATPTEPTLTALDRDVYAVMSSDNSMFAVFPDYVVLVEAPRRESNTMRIFQLIESVAPGKPVKVVSTHFHEDHIAGVRYAVSRGAEIWTTSHAKSEIERKLSIPWTMRPDALARAPREATIHVIDKRHVFAAGNQRVEIAPVGPTEHVEQMLAAFFPNIGTLYTADVWDVPASSAPTPGLDAARVTARSNALGWKVQRMLPTHGVPTGVDELNRSLDLRAKYVRSADAKHRLR